MVKVVAVPPLPSLARRILAPFNVVEVEHGVPGDELARLNLDADALVLVGRRVSGSTLSKALRLRLVVSRSSGAEEIDHVLAEGRGICTANSPEVIAEAVAEHAIAGILAVLRNVIAGHLYVLEGRWWSEGWPYHLRGELVVGRSLGLVGAGRIGWSIAVKLRALGVKRVYYWARSRKPYLEVSLGAIYLPFEEIFELSDIVVVSLPLTRETRHLITYEHLKALPRGAVFVNVGRGKVVEPGALERLLEERDDVRLVIDVYYEEPIPPGSGILKFLRDSRVIVTPHIAGYSHESFVGSAVIAAMQVKRFFEEECVWNPMNSACKMCSDSPPPIDLVIDAVRRSTLKPLEPWLRR